MGTLIYIALIWCVIGLFIFLFSNGIRTVKENWDNWEHFRVVLFLFVCGPVIWIAYPGVFAVLWLLRKFKWICSSDE